MKVFLKGYIHHWSRYFLLMYLSITFIFSVISSKDPNRKGETRKEKKRVKNLESKRNFQAFDQLFIAPEGGFVRGGYDSTKRNFIILKTAHLIQWIHGYTKI